MQRYKTISFLTFLIFSIISSYSQKTVSGYVGESEKIPIPYCNVILYNASDSSFISGTTTDEEGIFQLEGSENIKGYLKFSSLGFQDQLLPLQDDNQMIKVILSQSSELLNEVTINARKTMYQQKSDRLVVNIGNLPSFAGDNALQVLQKSPGVIVQEFTNSINLNGKGDVMIMINDKVSRVPLSALFARLRGMKAENIDRIEIIHQPSAEYDAGNLAGIIHIVLKKNNDEGFNGNLNISAGYGEKFKSNGGVNFNYRKNNMNLYGDISGFNNYTPTVDITHYRKYTVDGDQYFFENTFTWENEITRSSGINFGLDYNLSPNTVIGVLLGYNNLFQKGIDYPSYSSFYENNLLIRQSEYLIQTQNPNISNFQNLNILQKLNPKSNLNIDLDRVNLQITNYTLLESIPINEVSNEVNRKSTFDIFTFKTDYTYNFNKEWILKTGIKAVINQSDSDFTQEVAQKEVMVTNIKDHFDESIYAAYMSFNKRFGSKFDLNLGARYERYHFINSTEGQSEDFEVLYNNVFPTLNLSYKIDSIQNLNLSFNRRTERAAFMFIAGFYFTADPSLTILANNKIRPAFANALRLTYQHKSLLLALEGTRTLDAINFYNRVDKEKHVQISNIVNNDRFEQLQLQISYPFQPIANWEAYVTVSGAYQEFNDSSNRTIPFSISGFNYNVMLNNTVSISKKMTFTLNGRYISPFLAGDQKYSQGTSINTALNYKLPNQGAITLSINDVLRMGSNVSWEYDHTLEQMKTYGFNDFSERLFMITFSQPFGNNELKSKRNRTTGSQEERNRM